MARLVAGAVAAMIVGVLAIGALGPPAWRATVADDGPACPWKWATGVDCPFCGLTRATLAIGDGDFGTAFALHPLAPLVVAGVLALLVIIALGRGDQLVRGRRPQLLLAAIVVVWVVRSVV
jgi:hypothetical protein